MHNQVALSSPNKFANLGLRHIQTLQEASKYSERPVLFIGQFQPEKVEIFVNLSSESAVIEFINPKLKKNNFEIPFSDYTFLLSNLILG